MQVYICYIKPFLHNKYFKRLYWFICCLFKKTVGNNMTAMLRDLKSLFRRQKCQWVHSAGIFSLPATLHFPSTYNILFEYGWLHVLMSVRDHIFMHCLVKCKHCFIYWYFVGYTLYITYITCHSVYNISVEMYKSRKITDVICTKISNY